MNDITTEYDCLVIGSGIAGLSAAIKLDELGLKTLVITKNEDIKESNSTYAQGGIVYMPEGDSSFVDDVIKASANGTDQEVCSYFERESGRILKEILIDKAQTNFQRDEKGELSLTKEAAHSKRRIIYKGDYSGREIINSLIQYVEEKCENVTIKTSHIAFKLNKENKFNSITGCEVLDILNNKVISIDIKSVFIATGGVGSLYLNTSNTFDVTGDGHSIAEDVGAEIQNMEFIQFHPTTFYLENSNVRFLVSESVRGEGAILRNSDGIAFMEYYHPDKELGPRDVVSRAITQEMKKTNSPCVFLDVSHLDQDWFEKRFPTIFDKCIKHNVDLKKGIPVVPAAHYSCGGIKVDINGKTNIQGLYAVGEVACTGMQIANRLASTALLEGVVLGNNAALDCSDYVQFSKSANSIKVEHPEYFNSEKILPELEDLTKRVKNVLWEKVGIWRNDTELNEAFEELYRIDHELNVKYEKTLVSKELIELRSMLTVGKKIIQASLDNQTAQGCFFKKETT